MGTSFQQSIGSMACVTCSRCQQQGHATAACPNKSFIKRCTFCTQVGHEAKTCQERRKQAVVRHAEWAERQSRKKDAACSRTRNAEWLVRHAAWRSTSACSEEAACLGDEVVDDFDSKSTTSVASTSTAATKTARTLFLTEQETREARKYAKLLREIAVIEEKLAYGEKLEKTQLDKIQRRVEIEATLVMQKVRAGYISSGG